MNSFLRTILVMVAGLLLLGAAEPEGAQPFSPDMHYDSSTFIHGNFGNFKTFFQKQWRDNCLRVQCGKLPTEEARQKCLGQMEDGSSLPPERWPLSMSSFRMVSQAPVMPKRVASGVGALEPERRKALEGALVELLKGYEQLLSRQDRPQLKDNLAGAFNYLFISSFYALRNGQELNGPQQRSVLEQINAGIALGLNARRLSDREKQELYESVVLSGSVILGLYNEGRDKGRSSQQKEAQELAEELLEQTMGIDLEKAHLESNTVCFE
jgi:hypothetical protein